MLHKLFRLGYCRAAECFAKADPWVTQGLWRPGMRLSYAHLPGIAAQLDELVEFLLGADPFCCINAMLTFRQKYSKPNPERMAGLHIKQLPLPDTEDVLQQVRRTAEAQAARSKGRCDSPSMCCCIAHGETHEVSRRGSGMRSPCTVLHRAGPEVPGA